jgi:hypothetical protein
MATDPGSKRLSKDSGQRAVSGVDDDPSSVHPANRQVAEINEELSLRIVRPGSLVTLRPFLCAAVSPRAIGLKDRDLVVSTVSSIKYIPLLEVRLYLDLGGLVYASPLTPMGSIRSFIFCNSVARASLCPLAESDAVNILKVKPSLQCAISRRRISRKRAAHHAAIIQLLDMGGYMT